MNLYQYFKAISQHKNRIANPVIIVEDEDRQLASITYNQISPQFSWDIPYMLSARGLVVDMQTGDIVARPYPKFFNYGENERAKWPENISSITVEEKLDGSLAIISTYKDELVVASSNSLTSKHVKLFTNYLKNNLTTEQYNTLKELGKTYTILCEYVSPENTVVLHYTEENMILHGMIQTYQLDDAFSHEVSYDTLLSYGKLLGLDVVKQYEINSLSDVNKLLETEKDIEGFVVKFDNGHRLKFKTKDYVQMHKISTNLDLTVDSQALRETFIVAIVNETYDDLIPFLNSETKSLLNEMLDTYRDFVGKAIRKRESYLKTNEHLAITGNPNIESIKQQILLLPDTIISLENELKDNITTYIDNVEDDDLLEKGYARVSQFLAEKSSKEKRIVNDYLKANIQNGLINTQELSRKQKQLVSDMSVDSIIDKHLASYLYNGELESAVTYYLRDVYCLNIELSMSQKMNAQYKTTNKLAPIISKLSISDELKQQAFDAIDKIQDEILSMIDQPS